MSKMDFTLNVYRQLLCALKEHGYKFVSFEQYCEAKVQGKFVILRHDVDLKAEHSLRTAHIESELGIIASYYFRVVSQSNKPEIIRKIVALGHEIGYHYEDMSLFKGDVRRAISHFEKKLNYFRQFYAVKTICMHGSPTSRYDNRDIWKSANYRDFGIIGEPYFDVDFENVFYITDTGRCWDGERYSVRDKVSSSFQNSYHSTLQIIHAVEQNQFPQCVMITTHPQRWTNEIFEWFVELVMQRMKNLVKAILIKR
jgi:hypothetical protein